MSIYMICNYIWEVKNHKVIRFHMNGNGGNSRLKV